MTQLTPIVNAGLLYANNCIVSRASATTLSISSGQFRDSNNILDLVLSSTTTLNAATNGLNGLDTGSLANNTWYYVFLIGDSKENNPTGTILSTSQTSPYLPSGYDSIKYIGQALTNGSAQFLLFYTNGTGNVRTHWWDTGINVVNLGTANTNTTVDLNGAVPPINGLPVYLRITFAPQSASQFVSVAPFGSSGSLFPSLSGTVASQSQIGQLKVNSVLSTTAKILYVNSAASCTTSIWVSAFDYYV